MKKLLILVLVFLMAVACASCGTTENAEDVVANSDSKEVVEVEEAPSTKIEVDETKAEKEEAKEEAKEETAEKDEKPADKADKKEEAKEEPKEEPKAENKDAAPVAETDKKVDSAMPYLTSKKSDKAPSAPAKEATIENASAYIGQSVSGLVAAIGQPKSKSYASSCIGDGEDGQWDYGDFTVYTYRDTKGNERVEDVFAE